MQYSGNITSDYGCEFMTQPRRFYPLRAKLYTLRERILDRRYDTHTLTEEQYRSISEKIDSFYVDGFGQWPDRNVLRIVDAHARKCVYCKNYIGNIPHADYSCVACDEQNAIEMAKIVIQQQRRTVKKAKKNLRLARQKLKELQAY